MKKFRHLIFTVIFSLTTGLNAYLYSQPVINSFSPDSGSVGTPVTIIGTDLNNTISFTIGGKEAIIISNDGNTLVGMVMPGSGTGNISVTTVGGTFDGTDNFIVIQSLLPAFQQGDKLIGSDTVKIPRIGYSVALSADGSTAIVGGAMDNNDQGAAWIYTRNGNSWEQEGSKLVGTGNVGIARQGFTVALSADGNTALVGGYLDYYEKGAAWVFTRTGKVWTQQGNKLVGTGNSGNAQQGYSVSLSADGNTAIIGGYWDQSGAGAAWVFTRSNNIWTQQGNKLVGTDHSAASFQGFSVALSADGNTAILGGYNDSNPAVGAAWVFTRADGTWAQQGSKLVGTGNTGGTKQGRSVALSSDGNTAIIGGYSDDNNIGAAWIFTRTDGLWTQQGEKLVGTGNIGQSGQGSAVSLSADGNTALIGGSLDDTNTGAVWIFKRDGDIWAQQGAKLLSDDYIGESTQGRSVSISADGNIALVGGYGDDNYIGAAWIYSSLLAPLATNADNISENGFSANWNKSSGATGYYLDVATDSLFVNLVNNNAQGDEDIGNILSSNVAGLNNENSYYYRLKAYTADITSEYSNVISVKLPSSTGFTNPKIHNIKISPNPANDVITLSGLAAIQNNNLCILISDYTGKTLKVIYPGKNTDSENINISSLPDGIYFLSLQNGNETIAIRFVKQ